jgi:autophagy-related protein 2
MILKGNNKRRLHRKGEVLDHFKLQKGDLTIFLYDGYDLTSTRRTIENEVKEMKKRLAKIRQLVADGQEYDPSVEETSTLLFNSIYVGLQDDAAEMEPDVLIAAIDEELKEDLDPETATQSSWQSLKPQQARKPASSSAPASTRPARNRRLTRASAPSIEFKLQGVSVEHAKYAPGENLSLRTFATVRDAEILDHVKTSTWRKFLTALRSDSRGNIRETGSNMVRVELQNIRPVSGSASEEARLRVSLLLSGSYINPFLIFNRPNFCHCVFMSTRMPWTFSRSFSCSRIPMPLWSQMPRRCRKHIFVSFAPESQFLH